MSDRHDELVDIAGPVSRETFDALLVFEREFRRWSERINLASPTTLDDLWRRHVLDSAQLMRLMPEARQWLDLGSGGGFPGAIVAILTKDRPGSHVDLVESSRKKAAFLQTTLSVVGAPAKVHSIRIEQAPERVAMPDVVTARALAPLPSLIDLAFPWISGTATALFHKGRDYAREVADSRYQWQFDLVEHTSRIDPASRVLQVSRVERRDDGRPAKPSA